MSEQPKGLTEISRLSGGTMRRYDTQNEAEVVEAIRTGLELLGYIVVRVNQQDARNSGSDVCGDLLITHEKYDPAEWIMIEVKTAAGRLGTRRPAHRGFFGYSQQDLFDKQRMFLCRSLEEAQTDIARYEKRRNTQRGK